MTICRHEIYSHMCEICCFEDAAAMIVERVEKLQKECDEARRIASENAEQCRSWNEAYQKRMDQIEQLEKERDKYRDGFRCALKEIMRLKTNELARRAHDPNTMTEDRFNELLEELDRTKKELEHLKIQMSIEEVD